MKPWQISKGFASILAATCLPLASAHAMQMPSSLFAQPTASTNLESLSESSLPVAAADAPDDSVYADAMRAIHENRWEDATSLFLRAAQMHLGHAEGALYWAAYSENKQGQSDRALATCAELRKTFPSSRWLQECGALEIDIHSASGDPIDPGTQQDEQLKLLALNSMMKKDESRALPQIQQILQGDQPELFKEKALFILAQSTSPQAQKMLSDTATSATDPALRTKAHQMFATLHSNPANSGTTARDRRIALDVTVTDATGKPVTGLHAQEFSVLDDGKPRPVIGFRPVGDGAPSPGGSEAIAEVVIVIDILNTSLADIADERVQIGEMLSMNGGKLAYPTSILLFNGDRSQSIAPATQDGFALAAKLSQIPGSLHDVRRASAFYGAEERVGFSLKALSNLIVEKGPHPGKKLVLWISPGWPLLAIQDGYSSARQDRTNFNEIVALSSGLRQARIVLYCIDPPRSAGGLSTEWFLYQRYRTPVRKQSQANAGDFALQLLAEQSGGLALNFNDRYLADELQQTIANAGPGYLLLFDAPPAHQADEFHDLKVTANRPGLTVRTRVGYYNQP